MQAHNIGFKAKSNAMLNAFSIILRNPAIRIATLTLFAFGMTYGATLPYLPIVGINEFGMSDQMLSGLLFAIAFANLAYGVSIAIFSDMVQDRKPLLLVVSVAGIIGYGLIYTWENIVVFVLCAVLLVPLSNSSYSLLFASIRSLTLPLGAKEAMSVNQVVRALYSGSWVLVPSLMAVWLMHSKSMLPAWGFSGAACLICLLLVLFFMPSLKSTGAAGAPKVTFFASLKVATSPYMLSRITAMSLVIGASRLVGVIQPLIMMHIAGGKITDVGAIAGLCAFLEIPSMLIWGALLKRLSVLQALGAGTVIYAVFMGMLSFATTPPQIYLLVLPNAFGVSAILSLPLSYYQDLLIERPGLGTSLNQMSTFVSTGMCSLAFAGGAAWLGYSNTAWLGVGMALAGVVGLFALDRRQATVAA
jgi:predicted MFS family arabinose efflux permease